MTHEELERAAQMYEAAAAELDRAAGHCRVAAEHYRNVEQPRGGIHAWAARGHLLNAEQQLDEAARKQASRSLLPGDDGYR
jgi:hypothetical protein